MFDLILEYSKNLGITCLICAIFIFFMSLPDQVIADPDLNIHAEQDREELEASSLGMEISGTFFLFGFFFLAIWQIYEMKQFF
jgi:hypothetical protein